MNSFVSVVVLLALLCCSLAEPPPGYRFPNPTNPLQPGGQPHDVPTNCPEGQVPHVDGTCVEPEVMRTIFVYDAPQQQFDHGPAPEVPKPKLHYNIVFVRTPEGPVDKHPIVVPPPQQKTLVYVLNKGEEGRGQQVIEVPAPQPEKPEVFYINFKEGENPQLPIGIDLQSALASVAAQQGQVIAGGSATIGGALSLGGGTVNGGGGQGQGGGSFRNNQFPEAPGGPSNVYGSPRSASSIYGTPERN